MSTQKMEFQAEVKQILNLVIHSLYSQKEIFLRELVSNASDALDKLRFESLKDSAILGSEPSFKIDITVNKENNTLVISDNGIGMNQEDLINNLGTIARSGTKSFMEALKNSQDNKGDVNLIGQFGVGFYSAFMVADKIQVRTRKANSEQGYIWISEGAGDFEIGETDKETRGTEITLFLKTEEKEYSESWQIQNLVRKYSEFVSHPITLHYTRENTEGEGADEVKTIEEVNEVLNEKPALWRRPKSEITDEQYKEFYEHIAHDYTAPFAWNHARVEGTQEYTYLLYAPGKAPHGIFQQDSGNGLKLYVKRIFIMDECKEFLPPYLRFMKGIVDSEDLPLNVSREILQSNKIVSQIKKTLTKKSLEMLKEKATSDAAGYQVFWKELGNVLKEGFYMNWEHTEELKELVRFESTHTEKGSYTSLKDVVSRFREGQKDLFFITGESRAALENSPHLEVFKDKGIEVIFMVDAIDEWVVQSLTEYDSKKLVNVTKGDLDLGDLTKEETEKKKEHEGEYKTFLESVAKHLNSKVKEVRLTSRLKDSPACVVAGENDMGANMERILKMSNQTFDVSKKILEINPEHAISKKALKAFETDGESSDSQDWMEYLYGQALIAEGSELPDPASYVKLINKMLAQ